MFVAGSNCIFTDEYLTQLRPSKPIDTFNLPHMCKLKVYKNFDPNDFYLVGVDTARSLVGDLCAIEIFQYTNFEQTAEFISRIGSLTKFSEVVKEVIKFLYKQVGKKFIVGIENNSMGIAIVESLENDNEFDYMQFLYKEEQKKNSKVEKPYGIYTSQKSKDKMVALFYDEITTDPTLLHSGELISQLSIIEKDSMGRVAAQKGQHDDLFMASCFCALVKKDRQFEIEPQISVNSEKFLKDQEDLIQNIINIESKNKQVNIADYFSDSEISRFDLPIIREDKDNKSDDFTHIPFPEFF